MLPRMPRRYSMESRQEETAARRRRLLDAAVQVLGEVGADRLTMEAVAERADAATRTLYNHFSSRDELIAAAVGLLLQETRDSLCPDTTAEGDPAERLRLFVRLVYGVFARQGDSLTTLLGHQSDPQVGLQVSMMRQSRREHLEEILKDPQAKLLLPVQQAAAIAFVLTSHETWKALVKESGLPQPVSLDLVTATLDTVLFGRRPG
jgi:TetR/AcrR family transcriptional regulator, transcriptional repressor of bet genes